MTDHQTSRARALILVFAALLIGYGVYELVVGPRPKAHSTLAVHVPQGMEARSTALFLLGDAGWTPVHETRAKRLADMHTLVIGIDAVSVLHDSGGSCAVFAETLNQIARAEQKAHGAFARTPVLVGFGGGADSAVAAAWSAPEQFKGLVTEAAPNAHGICLSPNQAPTGKAPLRWLDVASAETSAARTLAGATVVEPSAAPDKAFYQSYLRLAGTDSAFDVSTGAGAELKDLPLTVHYNKDATQQDAYAIFLSGDGGWARFDEEISDRLADAGIPVVGISSLRYMWREKPPQQIATDFTRIDHHFRNQFARPRVMLLGFSLGANTVPFAAAELPAPMKDRLAGVALIAPETLTGFEIVVGGWLGQQTGATEVPPAIETLAQQLPANRILCLHGSKETVSACPAADVPGMVRVEFEGGHHLGKDHDGIVDTILQLVAPSAE